MRHGSYSAVDSRIAQNQRGACLAVLACDQLRGLAEGSRMVDAVHSERDLVWRNETLEFHIQVEACAGENLCAVQGIKGLGLTLWNRADNHREREHRPAHGYKSCPACSGSKTACRGSLCTVRCEARQRRRARRLALRGGTSRGARGLPAVRSGSVQTGRTAQADV